MNEGETNKASGIIQTKYSGLTTLFTLILFIRSAETKPAISQEVQKLTDVEYSILFSASSGHLYS